MTSYAKEASSDDTSRTSDSVIASYSWAIVGSHLIVCLYFLDTDVLSILRKGVEPLCWPYFQSCSQFRFDSTTSIIVLICIELSLIALAVSALAARWYRIFWVLMVLLNLYVFAIMSLDYRFKTTEFYMLFWLNAVFLFWPSKRWAIPLILVSFYFWAGTLKLNYEWLSGAVLYHDLYLIPSRLAWAACTYVVVLEIFLIWGLLASRPWIRWLTLGQLVLFHLESFSQIHWFYPLLMGTLLSWFVIYDMSSVSPRTVSLDNLVRARAPKSAYVLLAVFGLCQLVPYFYHGSKALTGQGRIFTMHMFEARQMCDVHALIHYADRTTDDVDLFLSELHPRIVCDPIIYFDRATNLCQAHAADPNFTDLDFIMHAKRATDATMTTIADEPNFCSRHEVYRMFLNNNWIR